MAGVAAVVAAATGQVRSVVQHVGRFRILVHSQAATSSALTVNPFSDQSHKVALASVPDPGFSFRIARSAHPSHTKLAPDRGSGRHVDYPLFLFRLLFLSDALTSCKSIGRVSIPGMPMKHHGTALHASYGLFQDGICLAQDLAIFLADHCWHLPQSTE